MWRLVLWTVGGLRLVLPILILKYPLLVTLALILLDSADGYLAFRARLRWRQYHVYDKILDWWSYLWITVFAQTTPIGPAIAVFFLYRSIGQVITIASRSGQVLIFFPNLIEPYFYGYLLSWIFPSFVWFYLPEGQFVGFTLALLIALAREYIIHIKKFCMGNYFLKLNFHWKHNERRRR